MVEWKHTSYAVLRSVPTPIQICKYSSEGSRYHLPDDLWEGIVTTSYWYAEINLNES
jgi:hypothetical protein